MNLTEHTYVTHSAVGFKSRNGQTEQIPTDSVSSEARTFITA